MVFDPVTYEVAQGHVAFDENGTVGSAVPAPAPVAAPAPPAAAPGSQPAEVAEQHQEQEQPQPDQPQPEPAGPHELVIPDFLPASQRTEAREGLVREWATLAPTAGVSAELSQELLNVVADAGTALSYSIDHEHVTADEARAEVHRLFGEATGKQIVSEAQRYVAKLGPEVSEFLDRTGLGSDPACLVGLALASAGFLSYSPEQAKVSIDKLMATPGYMRGDKLTLVKIQALARRVHRSGSQQDALNIEAVKRHVEANPLLEREHAEVAAATTKATARAEVAALLADKNGPLMNSGHRDHAAAIQTYLALVAKI